MVWFEPNASLAQDVCSATVPQPLPSFLFFSSKNIFTFVFFRMQLIPGKARPFTFFCSELSLATKNEIDIGTGIERCQKWKDSFSLLFVSRPYLSSWASVTWEHLFLKASDQSESCLATKWKSLCLRRYGLVPREGTYGAIRPRSYPSFFKMFFSPQEHIDNLLI